MTNRDLDAEIAEKIYQWKSSYVGKDANGENACEVLFPPGKENDQDYYNMLPNIGKPHKGFFVPAFSSDLNESIKLAVKVGMRMDIAEIDFKDWQFPEKLAKKSLDFWESSKRYGKNSG